MEARKTFAQILKKDSRMRLLLGGMLLDCALMLALIITAGVVIL